MVYTGESDWYGENVVAALGRESALKLFYSDPGLIVTFADRGDALPEYEPQNSRIFFFDYMGNLSTPDETERPKR